MIHDDQRDPGTEIAGPEDLPETTEASDVVEALPEEDEDEPVKPWPTLPPIAEFADAGMHDDVLAVVGKIGWTKPTPVQGMCLPYSISGRDVAGFAQTGTGKTGVFLMTAGHVFRTKPPVEGRGQDGASRPFCLVLAPTRELAMQIENDGESMFKALGIKSMAVFGGVDYEKQGRELQAGAVDLVVATPGRLKDFVQKKIIALDQVSLFVCDEVDRMFDMGFIEDVEFFLEKLQESTQKLIFSATTNEEVKELSFEYLNRPEYISVNPEKLTPDRIEQHAIIVDAPNKLKVLMGLMRDHQPTCAIIFTNTKITAEWLHFKLVKNGIEADLITGDLPQKKRISLIHRIKEGTVKVLIATDVASRGLHISRVTHVYNFDLPDEAANYVHRVGRTARAGAKGSAFSLVCEDYGQNLAAINQLLGDGMGIKSQWFSSEYLKIEDKAGNPFEGRDMRRGAARRGRGDDRGGSGGGRDQGRDRGGPGRGRGPDRDRDRGGRDRPGQGPGREHSAGGRGPRPGGEPGRYQGSGGQNRSGNQPAGGRASQGRPHGGPQGGHDGPRHQGPRHDGRRGHPGRIEAEVKGARTEMPRKNPLLDKAAQGRFAESGPLATQDSTTGLLKRIWGVFFGSGKGKS